MKMKHNKKRNSLFLYETLIRELTKAVVEKSNERKDHILEIIKTHFKKGSMLAKEMELYNILHETRGVNQYIAEKLLHEVKCARFGEGFSEENLFDEQTAVINDINKKLSPSVFSNFIPNYKNLATISQIFSNRTTVRKRVVLEESMIKKMITKNSNNAEGLEPVDNIVYSTFVDKFNQTYNNLLKEQNMLLKEYIMSFNDNGLGLKVYLNEEIGRLKTCISESIKNEEIKDDPEMVKKTKSVIELLEGFRNQIVSPGIIKKVLKIQSLAHEIKD